MTIDHPDHRRPAHLAEGADDYLKLLGERVRNARARRGMTRKILSRDSGVSERYLAQLESGQGNVSIQLLRQIALAMGIPVIDLLREGPDLPVEYTLLREKLMRLSPRQLLAAAAMLTEHFGAGGDRQGRIALIGLRGAGKTTLGRALAQRLQRPFVELVKDIEADAGLSLNEIFSLSGQAAYRRHERRALDRTIESHSDAVIATGGSLVSEPSTFDRLLDSCFVVWVRASPEEHMDRVLAQGDYRPMAGNNEAMTDLRRILTQREALYSKADAQLDTTAKPIEQCLAELLAIVRERDSATAIGRKS